MRMIFRRMLCAGFLIGLFGVCEARPVAFPHADPQIAKKTDSKLQQPSPEPTVILSGKIGGKYPLRMELHREENRVSGRYRYVNKPKAGYLVLKGAIDNSGAVELTEYAQDKKTGTFKGVFTGQIIGQSGPTNFVGAWTGADESVSLEFRLSAEAGSGAAPADSAVMEDRINIKGKLQILRHDPEFPIPKDVSFKESGGGLCCYYRQPLISGKQPAQVLYKIRNSLELKTVYDVTIPSLIEELYDTDDKGKRTPNLNAINIDYQVGYNENYILSFTYDKFDAFPRPQFHSQYRVFDLKTGNVVRAKDIFMPDTTRVLARMLDLRLQSLMKDQLAEYRKDASDEEYNDLKEMLARQSFTIDRLDDFTVDGHGVTFYYAYGVTPFYPIFDTEILTFTYEELKRYINPKGILGRFI